MGDTGRLLQGGGKMAVRSLRKIRVNTKRRGLDAMGKFFLGKN